MKTFAFDIDGTLLKKDGEIDSDVFPMLEHENFTKNNLIFATGNTKKVIDAFIEKAKEQFVNLKSIKAYCAAINGAVIYAPNGEIIYDAKMDKTQLISSVKQVCEEDQDAILLYTTSSSYIVSQSKDESKQKIIDYVIEHESKKGILGLTIRCVNKTDEEIIKSADGIYGLAVFSNNRHKLYEKLVKIYSGTNYSIYEDDHYNTCLVGTGKKWQALLKIVESEKNNKNFAKSAEDIIYFGDGHNDIECLENCKISYARGRNLDKRIVQSAKNSASDLTEVAKELLG